MVEVSAGRMRRMPEDQVSGILAGLPGCLIELQHYFLRDNRQSAELAILKEGRGHRTIKI